MSITTVLFDADGVLTLPEEFFVQAYARSRGLDPTRFDVFFKEHFPAALVGKADLKDLIRSDSQLWQWHGAAEDLLSTWFKAEDARNAPLIKVVDGLRTQGCVAT